MKRIKGREGKRRKRRKMKRRKEKKKTPLDCRITKELEMIKLNACGFNPMYLNAYEQHRRTNGLRVLSDIQRYGNK